MSVTYNNRFWYGHHVRMNDFETTKKMYEQTKPLAGSRKKFGLDQRPLSVRRRTWETWHKDDEGKYGMAFRQSYKQHQMNPVTKKNEVSGYNDTVRPFLMWESNGTLWFYPQWMNSYSTWEMLSALLPDGIKFSKYGAKQYFRVESPEGDMYYYISGLTMSFVPYESGGKRYFKPMAGVVREEKMLIDRKQSKRYREEFNAFLDYFQPMADLLCLDAQEINWSHKRDAEDYLATNDWLMRKDGEEYGEKWINGVENLLKAHTRSEHHWIPETKSDGRVEHTHKWIHHLPDVERLKFLFRRNEQLYRMVRPYRKEAVPLGTPFFDNGRK